MATKQTTKAGSVKITLSQVEQVKLASEFGVASHSMYSARAAADAIAAKLRDAGAKVGDARKCPLAKAFLAARFPNGKTAAGKDVAASSKANALAAFRAAVASGKTYDENAIAKAAAKTKKIAKAETGKAGTADIAQDDESEETEDKPAKGKTHIGTAETATTYACTIARKGSAKKASQTLRDLVNKMRDSEEYAPLCLLIIDALDEFDGTAE